MVLMAFLGALVLLGLVAIWRWGNLDVEAPWPGNDVWPLPASESIRRFFWHATVGITAGLFAGVVALGAGGRLAMRLLAVTAGDDAQGAITEAHEVVGKITFGGTLGFIGFNGILVGTFLGVVYVLVRRWLPSGRWGGIAFGLLLLILVATRVDPLRPENPDFDLVGPGWVAIAAFSAVVIGFGMLVAALAARYSRWLPLVRKDWKAIAKYLPAYIVWGPSAFILAVPLLIGCGAAALIGRTEKLKEFAEQRRVLLAGRALGLTVAVASLPGFLIGVADIATRG